MFTRKTRLAAAALPLLLLALTACNPGVDASPSASTSATEESDQSSIPDIEPDADLAARVPEPIQESGLVIATSADTPPMTYTADDDTTMVGFDVDMSRAIAAVLDVDANIRDVGFDTIIPGLQSDRFNMALASMGVTKERQETVDFVSYYNGGQGFLAGADSDYEVSTFEDLCGRRVAVSKGTVQQTTLEDASTLCADAGLEDWELQAYPDLNQAVLAIKSARSDVLYGSISIIGYTAEHDDSFRIAGVYKRALVGIAFLKGSELVPVVQEAVQHLIDDGTYAEILAKWGLEDNGLETAEVNNAVS